MNDHRQSTIPRFDGAFFESGHTFARIGDGRFGGKALGLLFAKSVLDFELDHTQFPRVTVDIPRSVIVSTSVFDAFMDENDLYDVVASDTDDDTIARAFQEATLPADLVKDLEILVANATAPLAVRSSSMLEDDVLHPFAGVYETKMVPNHDADPAVRLRQLEEAVKFVYASTFSRAARSYLKAVHQELADEKMAVLIQEVVGARHGARYYPHVSGVAKSFNYYPSGRAKPDEGVVSLALGLGKTVVDSGVCWTYSPAHPKAPPPFGSVNDLLKSTQREFWSIDLAEPTEPDPTAETEYMVQLDLAAAEEDNTLRNVASTLDSRSGRLVMGTGYDGPRALTFAPLLEFEDIPLNRILKHLLSTFEAEMGTAIELEFAMTIEDADHARLGVVQVRLMALGDEVVEVDAGELGGEGVLIGSDRVIGNGTAEVHDVVYVKPDTFEARNTRVIADELARVNRSLVDAGRAYLLVGFGRWGSSDPWLGIPVTWGQICGAKAIVEATLPTMNVDPSQGSHFFQNMSSFRVSYFTVPHHRKPGIDWSWLDGLKALHETDHLRHVRGTHPIRVKVDGRSGRGVIRYNASSDD